MSAPTRPVLRYHGGKWQLAPWILGFMPTHRVYVEAFGGAASLLLRKSIAPSEVYNDLDSRVVTLFRVLRDPQQSAELLRRIELTPYARVEHETSYLPSDDPIECARRTVVRGMMGHGSRGATSAHRTGFRTARRHGIHAASDWSRYPEALRLTIERLRDVLVECRPAAAVISEYDGPDTLHYVDPPYVEATRTTPLWGRTYAHELTDDDHRQLAAVLHRACGFVVLSGYPCDLYDRELYPTWERHETGARADGRIAREVVWLNPACSAALRREQMQGSLLEGMAHG